MKASTFLKKFFAVAYPLKRSYFYSKIIKMIPLEYAKKPKIMVVKHL